MSKRLIRLVMAAALAIGVVAPVAAFAQDPPPPPPPDGPVRVGGLVKEPTRLTYVAPNYPEIARTAKVSGTVIIEIQIAKDGSVAKAKVLRPAPLLDEAALDAVKQWKYTVSYLANEPVEVLMVVTVAFMLK